MIYGLYGFRIGLHIHLCGANYTIGSAGVIGPVLSLLGFGIAVAGPLAIILGAELLIIYQSEKNTDGSIDIYTPKESLILLPVSIVLPGSIPICIKIGNLPITIYC